MAPLGSHFTAFLIEFSQTIFLAKPIAQFIELPGLHGMNCFDCFALVVRGDLDPEVPGSGMNDQPEVSVAVLVYFDEVVAAAEGSEGHGLCVEIPGFCADHVVDAAVLDFRPGVCSNVEAARDVFPYDLVQVRPGDVFLA